MRRPAALSLVAFAVTSAVLAGCSSGSSSGPPAGGGTPEPVGADGVNRSAVDTSLHHVLSGLTAITSSTAAAGTAGAITSLHTGSTDLTDAADELEPTPAGVPATLATGVHTGLLNVAGLMSQAADCLDQQSKLAKPSPASCAGPLRKADKATTALAHALISLSAYSSDSPTAFEAELVSALGGS